MNIICDSMRWVVVLEIKHVCITVRSPLDHPRLPQLPSSALQVCEHPSGLHCRTGLPSHRATQADMGSQGLSPRRRFPVRQGTSTLGAATGVVVVASGTASITSLLPPIKVPASDQFTSSTKKAQVYSPDTLPFSASCRTLHRACRRPKRYQQRRRANLRIDQSL